VCSWCGYRWGKLDLSVALSVVPQLRGRTGSGHQRQREYFGEQYVTERKQRDIKNDEFAPKNPKTPAS
jgi:hypothetical protein